MAHRGHNYPLTFRRDFNLNVNTYQGGLSHDYVLSVPTFTFPDWPALRNTTWVCGPAADDVPPKLIWRSDVRRLSGHDWQFRLVGTLTGTPLQFFEPVWYLAQDGTDVCAWQMAASAPSSGFPDNGIRGRLLFYDGAVFPSGPGSIGLVEVAPDYYP